MLTGSNVATMPFFVEERVAFSHGSSETSAHSKAHMSSIARALRATRQARVTPSLAPGADAAPLLGRGARGGRVGRVGACPPMSRHRTTAAAALGRWSPLPTARPALLDRGVHAASAASATADATRDRSRPDRAPTAVIALGSNQGDRVGLFREALRALRASGVVPRSHSSLYETAPAYVTDQPAFLNAAVIVRVEDESVGACPVKLLDVLKRTERRLGRADGGRRFGPRPIDLDILFHDAGAFENDRLVIPHPRFHERDFVLAPLADLALEADAERKRVPNENANANEDPIRRGLRVARALWRARGGEANVGTDAIRRVAPFGKNDALRDWGRNTAIMGILNATPDSFSDGGALSRDDADADGSGTDAEETLVFKNVDVGKAVARAREMVADGALFIDVGGQSTRPGATRVSAAEETRRVVPVVRALAEALRNTAACVSVDTFYGAVAGAAADAGADVVNDVSGGTLCPAMLRAVAATTRPLPYVCMHMRGDPHTMQSRALTTYAEDDVPGVVGRELLERARAAAAAGVEPWRVWSDPGIGFAKTSEGNWDALAHLDVVRSEMARGGAGALAKAPMLVGVSRKGFLGEVTGHKNARDRDRATAAACAAAVAAGADVVRVHDVAAVVDAVRVADAVRAARRRRRDRARRHAAETSSG